MRALAPSFAAVALVVALVVAAARASATGFQAGGYPDFSLAAFSSALSEAIVYTTGLSLGAPFATIAAALGGILAMLAAGVSARRFLYAFALLAFPAVLAVALARIGNGGFARYYLVASIAALLLVAEIAGAGIAGGTWRRTVTIGVVAIIMVASLGRDAALASSLRGDPARAIATMRAFAPRGASVGIDTIRPTAVLDAAARTAGYRIEIRRDCPAAAFAFTDLEQGSPAPPRLARCGERYARIAVGRWLALSGFDWALYARIRSQKPKPSRR